MSDSDSKDVTPIDSPYDRDTGYHSDSELRDSFGLHTPETRHRPRSRTQMFSAPPRGRAGTTVYETKRIAVAAGFDDVRSKLRRLQMIASGMSSRNKELRSQKAATLTRRDRNLVDTLSEEVDKAYKSLEKKDEDLKTAAEIGTQLLEKVDEQAQQIQELETKLSFERAQRKDAKDEKGEMRKRLKMNEIIIRDVKSDCETAQEQVRKLKAQLLKERNKQEEQSLSASRSAENELARMQSRIQVIETDKNHLEDELQQMKDELQDEYHKNRLLREEIAALESSGGVNQDHSLDKLPAELEKLQSERRRMEAQLAHLQETLRHERDDKKDLEARLNQALFQNDATRRPSENRKRGETVAEAHKNHRPSESAVPLSDDMDVPDDLPQMVMAATYTSLLVALSMFLVACVAFGEDIDPVVGVYIAIVSVMWIVFELKTFVPRLERVMYHYTPFLYNAAGRTVFLSLNALLCFALGLPGLVVGIVAFVNTIFVVFVFVQHPDLEELFLRHASMRMPKSRLSTPLLEEDFHGMGRYDSGPLHDRDSVSTREPASSLDLMINPPSTRPSYQESA